VNTQELLKALREAGRSDAHILVVPFVKQGSGPGVSGTYIMHEKRLWRADRWVVGHFDERGVWTADEHFDTEDEACQWIYELYTRPMPEPRPETPEEREESMEITRQQVAKYEQLLAERARKAQEGDESDR
jgi:hypothetical protein